MGRDVLRHCFTNSRSRQRSSFHYLNPVCLMASFVVVTVFGFWWIASSPSCASLRRKTLLEKKQKCSSDTFICIYRIDSRRSGSLPSSPVPSQVNWSCRVMDSFPSLNRGHASTIPIGTCLDVLPDINLRQLPFCFHDKRIIFFTFLQEIDKSMIHSLFSTISFSHNILGCVTAMPAPVFVSDIFTGHFSLLSNILSFSYRSTRSSYFFYAPQ